MKNKLGAILNVLRTDFWPILLKRFCLANNNLSHLNLMICFEPPLPILEFTYGFGRIVNVKINRILLLHRAEHLEFAVQQCSFKIYFQAHLAIKISYFWTRPIKITHLQSN